VFADRYHAHLLESSREAFQAVRYVLENWAVHAEREGQPRPVGVDPFSSASVHEGPPLVVEAEWWMLRVGIARPRTRSWAWLPRLRRPTSFDTAASGGDSCASAFPSEGGGP